MGTYDPVKVAEAEARAEEILRRPYRMVIRGTVEDGFLAEAPELPGCYSAGDTEADALEMLRDAMRGWISTRLLDSLPVPEPGSDEWN